jgi:hypothetical protein
MKTYWGNVGIDGLSGFTLRPLYPQNENNPRHSLDGRRMGRQQSRSGRGGEEKNSQSLTGIETSRPARSLVTILTELPRLPACSLNPHTRRTTSDMLPCIRSIGQKTGRPYRLFSGLPKLHCLKICNHFLPQMNSPRTYSDTNWESTTAKSKPLFLLHV